MTDPKTALLAIGGTVADAANTLPNIPAVPATDNAALNNILASVKLWIEKATDSGATGFASKQDLIRAGLIKTDESGNIVSTVDLNLSIPAAPSGLQANGSMTNILVQWDDPTTAYSNHGYTEIWAAETNNFTSAVMVGESSGFMFAHAVGEDTTRYYWIRFVSTAGIKGPFNSLSGTMGQTTKNPQYMLDTLTGQLTESQLYTSLNARINLIDGPSTTIGTIPNQLAQLQGQINAISNYPDYSGTVTYAVNDIVKYNGAIYKANQTTTGNLPTNTTYWTKIGDYSSLADAVAAHTTQINTLTNSDAAQASQISTLFAQVGTKSTIYRQPTAPTSPLTNDIWVDTSISYASDYFVDDYGVPRFKQYMWTGSAWVLITDDRIVDTQAALQTEQTTRANADSALSSQITTLSATVEGYNASTSAALVTEQTTRANADSALSQQVTALSSTVTTNYNTLNSAITSEQTARANADTALTQQITTLTATVDSNNTTVNAAIQSEATTRANVDTALATQINTVQTTVNGNTASIQTQQTSIDGLSAKYTVKIDNNGYVSGFGLASTANNATPYSEFAIVADKFSIAPVGSGLTANSNSPFFYLTTPTTINGVTVPAGAYMKSAYIHDAAITNTKVANAAIDSAKIADASITTAKINDAAISNAKIQDAAISTAKIQLGSITTAIIGDAQISNAKIQDGAITYAKIGDAQVDTLKIANQAVTFPVTAYTAGAVSSGTLQTATINCTGAPVFIVFTLCSKITGTVWYPNGPFIYLYRDETLLYSGAVDTPMYEIPTCYSYSETPSAGIHTYKIVGSSGAWYFSKINLFVMETKR